ncbi:MAG TPA: sialidase [Thermoanaerobaculia bacterium]|nr:sialidase [Thermoanaerobaculia bacterium]
MKARKAMKRRKVMKVTDLVRLSTLALALLACPMLVAAEKPAPEPGASTAAASGPFAALKFRYIGPEGNRVSAVAGVAGDPDVYYAGAASGGIWKTTDAGIHWKPIFDEQPVSSIGALAVAPSDPNVVWAGTGEAFIRSNISVGWGMFRSTDAGRTWARAGLEKTGRIARIVVDPRDPDVALACALGTAYGPQPERGVFRTADGGKSWTKTLFVDEKTGCSDLAMDPNNPRVVFAGTWQLEIHTWGRESGGPGGGLYRSADGGLTWKQVEGDGLPPKPWGKVGLAMTRANSARVYALLEVGDGVPWKGKDTPTGRLWRSDDAGEHWALMTADRQVAGRTHYYNRMAVEPDDPEEAYFLTASWAKTRDGGKTIIDPPDAEVPGGDHHDIWIDPLNGNRLVVGHDGGVSISINRGRSWMYVQLPIAQIYHVTVDDRVPYWVYGNRQDGPSTRGPSNDLLGVRDDQPFIPRGMWSSVGGGESGWATPDPQDPDVVWSSASGTGSGGGIVTRYDVRTNSARSVEVWPRGTTGWPAADLKYRFLWTFPLTISPHDHNRLYVGSQYVHQTTDGGATWQVISPDLTLNDKARQQISGGLTPDNIGVEYAGVVFAIAESRLKPGLLWAGTNDGQLQLTQDGGKTWTNVTAHLPGLPPWGTVSAIEPSRYEAGAAYVAVDLHQVDNRDPFVFKTRDYGRTWTSIVNGIPRSPLSYVHALREDPARRGLLYLGTENGLYVSFDDGGRWQPLAGGLPHAPVYSIAVQERFGDLVLATYGRGFWILDDVTALRRFDGNAPARPAQPELLPPRATYRWRSVEAPFAHFYDPVAGFNPPDGVPIQYWLAAAVKGEKDKATGEQKDEIEIKIEDAAGKVVRKFKGPAKAGLNRAWWDLNYDKTPEARLRTSPLGAKYIKVGVEGIPAPGVQRVEVQAPIGQYKVKLEVGGHELSQPLTVLKDPGASGSEADVRAQGDLMRDLLDDVKQCVEAINKAESARGQLAALEVRLGDKGPKEVKDAAEALDKKLLAVEEDLLQVRVTGRGQDALRWPMKVTEQLVYLLGRAADSDFAPTASQLEVHRLLHDEAARTRKALDDLLATDLAKFNAMLAEKQQSGVVATP